MPDALTDASASAGPDARSDASGHGRADAGADATCKADARSELDARTDASVCTGPDARTVGSAHTRADAHARPDACARTDAGARTDTRADSDAHAAPDASARTEPDASAHTEADVVTDARLSSGRPHRHRARRIAVQHAPGHSSLLLGLTAREPQQLVVAVVVWTRNAPAFVAQRGLPGAFLSRLSGAWSGFQRARHLDPDPAEPTRAPRC